MGSDSDWDIVKKAVDCLKEYGIETEVHVMSAHRTPAEACAFAKEAKKNGFGVIIAAAGMAAHLGGVLAAHTTLPVIGIPIKSSFDGLDALLATVQKMCIRDRLESARRAPLGPSRQYQCLAERTVPPPYPRKTTGFAGKEGLSLPWVWLSFGDCGKSV